MVKINTILKTENKYEYKIDSNTNIIIEKPHGDIFINDMIQMIGNIFSENKHKIPLNAIIDLSNSKPVFHIYELRKITLFLIKNNQKLHNTKVAFIINKPRHAVDAQISQDLADCADLDIEFKYFSTYNAAYRWLNI